MDIYDGLGNSFTVRLCFLFQINLAVTLISWFLQ